MVMTDYDNDTDNRYNYINEKHKNNIDNMNNKNNIKNGDKNNDNDILYVNIHVINHRDKIIDNIYIYNDNNINKYNDTFNKTL